MPGDQMLKINLDNHAAGGMPVRETYERLDDVREEMKMSTKMVVLNVGACDFKYEVDTDIVSLRDSYRDLIVDVQQQCPNASLMVSSVLPRSGKGFRSKPELLGQMNEAILSFNNLLIKLCDEFSDVHFVDHYLFAVDSDYNPRKELYDDDVHLNDKGKQKLSDAIFGRIKTVFFGTQVRAELLEDAF